MMCMAAWTGDVRGYVSFDKRNNGTRHTHLLAALRPEFRGRRGVEWHHNTAERKPRRFRRHRADDERQVRSAEHDLRGVVHDMVVHPGLNGAGPCQQKRQCLRPGERGYVQALEQQCG